MTEEELKKLVLALSHILEDGFKDGLYVGTKEDWIYRAQHAEDKLNRMLDRIKDILNA